MSFVKLSQLLNGARDADWIVALQSGKAITFEQFQKDVLSFRVPASPCRVALFIEDSYDFAVGFYALLLADCSIVFLPNIDDQTVLKFQGTFDCLITHSMEGNKTSSVNLTINAQRESLYFYTSGSTGEAKCIVKSLDMIERETEALEKAWLSPNVSGASIVYATVPHYHFYGFIFKLMWPLASGRAFASVTYGPWESLLEGLTENATIISSPAHLKRLEGIKVLDNGNAPLQIFSAGSALTHDIAQEVSNILRVIPTEIFGSTETGAIATRQFEDAQIDAWQPLEEVSVMCDDMGLMSVKSPYTFSEWIQTSDLISKKGNAFTFLGRADSIIKIEGKRVSLLEIETVIKTLGLVEDAVVALLSTEKLAALIVLSDSGSHELSIRGKFRLGRHLREALFAQGLPFSVLPKIWRFSDVIPTKETGKRDSRAIMNILEGDV